MTVQSRWPLPVVVNPSDRLCVLVEVPNERYHIAAFLGAMYELTKAYSWANDTAHTAKAAAAVWLPIFNALRLQLCSDFDCQPAIEEWIEEMSLCDNIRFDADGKLQVLCCGQWVDVDGQPSQGIGGPGQPGSGSPTPAAGGCTTYHAVLNGNDQWLSPAVVNSGDVVTVSNLQGAWSDGTGLWFCPQGTIFFAGNCTVPQLDPTDPIPSANHMALLSKISGTFTDVSGGTAMTVPGGVSNALLIFQANDPSLSDNGGQITFDVQVCNNQSNSWCYRINFMLTNGGCAAFSQMTGHTGDWSPGVGWVQSIFSSDNITYRNGVAIEIYPAVSIPAGVDVTVYFDYTLGLTDTPSDPAERVFNTTISKTFATAVVGAGQHLTGVYTGASNLDISFECDRQNGSPAGFHGTLAVTAIEFSSSTLPNPFPSSNC